MGYWSKNVSKKQLKYSAMEEECYPVVWAVLTLCVYVKYVYFKLRSDHNYLKWMMALNDPQGRLMIWRLLFMERDYEILYRPGRVHQVTDALSRLPQLPSKTYPKVVDELP